MEYIYTPLTKEKFNLEKKNIGISISVPEKENLENIGQREEYLTELSQELAKYLLAIEATLVYGGDLRKDGFTENLILEAKIVRDRLKKDNIHLINYLAWPIYKKDTEEVKRWEAEYRDVLRFKRVEKSVSIESLLIEDKFIPPITVDNCYIWAKCLTHMRQVMISSCKARICAGGKYSGYKGKIPGVLEEILITAERECPIYLLGGFGGVVQGVCQVYKGESIPEYFTNEWQIANNTNYEQLMKRYEKENERIDYNDIVNKIRKIKLCNGLTDEENIQLFNTVYIDEAIGLVLKGLNKLKEDKKFK